MKAKKLEREFNKVIEKQKKKKKMRGDTIGEGLNSCKETSYFII